MSIILGVYVITFVTCRVIFCQGVLANPNLGHNFEFTVPYMG